MKAHPAALAMVALAVIAIGTVAILYATGPGLPTEQATQTASASGSTTQSATEATSQSGEGQLALLVTDPPIAPAGVTDLYMTYDGVEVHQSNATSPSSGWVSINGSGTVELFQTVNSSLTIGAGQIAFGLYNAVRFSVTNGTVTYYGQNYTANFRADDLTALVPGGFRVTANQTAAVLYDISPVVINWGTRDKPLFLVTAKAIALPVPPSDVSRQVALLGFKLTLAEALRHEAADRTPRILVTNGTLSGTFLSATVQNTGNLSATIREVIVSPLPVGANAPPPSGMVPVLAGTLTFVVNSTGQLNPLTQQGILSPQVGMAFGATGYNMTAGSAFTFTFSGSVGQPIALGFGVTKAMTIMQGERYLITVIGDQALSSFVVVAG